jgi:chorismate mutase
VKFENRSGISFNLEHNNWLGQEKFIIAGPCSAESEEQVWETVKDFKKSSISAIRAGIWKPRTRPNSFEGFGEIALPWLVQASRNVDIPCMVEVATPAHVENALAAGVDMIWIGARTTVNPFAVQQLADCLKGINVPVFIKNPVNPDLALWMGALERIDHAGITKLAAIHRGFSSGKRLIYRNEPRWEIPIELKRLAPNIPLINDPSHICGRIDILQNIAQKAMDLEFDGLMIETHFQPSSALSDAEQQVTPQQLFELLKQIKLRSTPQSLSSNENLEQVRQKIDDLDHQLIHLLADRMRLSQEIGTIKAQNQLTIMQFERWRSLVIDRLKTGNELGLDRDFLLQILQNIHQLSIQVQMEIFESFKDQNP